MPENVTGFQPAENIKNQYISNSYQHLTHAFINLFPRRALLFNQVHLGGIQPQKCHSYFTRLKLVLITQSNMFA